MLRLIHKYDVVHASVIPDRPRRLVSGGTHKAWVVVASVDHLAHGVDFANLLPENMRLPVCGSRETAHLSTPGRTSLQSISVLRQFGRPLQAQRHHKHAYGQDKDEGAVHPRGPSGRRPVRLERAQQRRQALFWRVVRDALPPDGCVAIAAAAAAAADTSVVEAGIAV